MKTVGKQGSRQYKLGEVLGQGSFGKVYHSPPYAIKQMTLSLPPYLKNALQNQINILKAFKHDNIVQLYDVIYQDGHVYLIMQYCQSDLSKYLKKNKIAEEKAVEIFKQILSAFKELVAKGIIHRDLKPANILVNDRGQFKLADFGFAKFVDQFDSNMLQSCVGTPLYMAPQILKKGKYSTKCDIWSIGFIFFELVAGRVPWTGFSEANLLENISKRPLSIPEGVTDKTKTLLNRMLVANENDRIGWDELFKLALGVQVKPRSKSLNRSKQSGRSRSHSKQTPTRSEKQIPSQASSQSQSQQKNFAYSQRGLTDLFVLQLSEHFNNQKATKIAKSQSYMATQQQKNKINSVLQLFNEQVQKFFRQNLRLTAQKICSPI